MNHWNTTQFIPESEMAVIEAEASVTDLSMKLHRASRLAIGARERMMAVEEQIAAHVRTTGLSPSELVDYYCRRAGLIVTLGAMKMALVEAEDTEASAEVEWEQAVQHLANLLP